MTTRTIQRISWTLNAGKLDIVTDVAKRYADEKNQWNRRLSSWVRGTLRERTALEVSICADKYRSDEGDNDVNKQ